MNKLKHFRKQTGLSQAGFAKELGWWQSRIGNYESGSRTPNITASRVIIEKLNKLNVKCSIDDVFPSDW
ncbi:helix-turn-helix domain-containing protein [Pasteurellaceae bacterium TAE3-ERU1]|nr:helix-turn-helix domain-containing protein [Pasteurellaceae bacterium TAE3-ERU1]